jgi:hypothetical protein
MTVNYHGIYETNVIKHNLTKNESPILWYGRKLPQYFYPRKSRVKITTVIYSDIIITLAPRASTVKRFATVIYRFP